MEEVKNQPSDLDIKKWSEGNKHLENLLIACRENGIPSMFCCAGHDNRESAYIVFKMNKETIEKIYGIINSLRDKKNISLAFSRTPFFSDSKFAVYMHNEMEKNSIMDSMANAICKNEKLENLPRNSQILLELAELLISNKFNFDLTYYKLEEKMIYFRKIPLEDTNYPFKEKLKEIGFVSEEKGLITKYSIKNITDKNEQKVLERILKGIKGICTEFVRDKNTEYDERAVFERMISNNGELKKLSNNIITKREDKNVKKTKERD